MKTCARDGCKKRVDSKRAKFCTDPECRRVRDRESRRKSRKDEQVDKSADRPEYVGGVFSATLEELTGAGRMHTPAGQNALKLASRIDNAITDTGASLAALSKQHLAALAEAMRGAEEVEEDPIDELRNRRDKKRKRSA